MKRMLWKLLLGMLVLAGLSACTTPASKNTTAETIRHEMDAAALENVKLVKSDTVSNALLPPLSIIMPKIDSKPVEAKFDITVSNTPASQVFMAIVSGTRYNMLVPPEVNGIISLKLKDVTVFEALEAIRELYGYEYKVDASRIYIQPIALQTRLFQVNYLTAMRSGSSSLSVQSSSNAGSTGGTGGTGGTATTGAGSGGGSSTVTTTSNAKANFWSELEASLKAIIGSQNGRSVVINSMSGVIVVRAMPEELKNVMAYLKASQISIERQVILEAKIVEVQLNDGFQSGVDWTGLKTPALGDVSNSTLTVGQVVNGTALPATKPFSLATLGTTAALAGNTAGTIFGLAFNTNNFALLLNFLETQGNVHVLSSPRIATLNNQKAILKVGTDEYFVTGFSTTPGAGATAVAAALPATTTPTYTSMFSGIALDVTPNINENNEIILHVHPSVTAITEKNKFAMFGAGGGTGGTIPMASTSVEETDSIVRAHDGQIVVIGGLMRQTSFDDQSGLPGLPKGLFGQTNKHTEKRELVILLKPTVVDSDKDWSDDIAHSRDRMNSMANASGARP